MVTVNFRASAQREYAKFRDTYGIEAASRLRAWLEELATDKKGEMSEEFDPEKWLDISLQFRKNWQRWLESGILEKVRAVLYVVKNRTPPWDFRVAETELEFLDGVKEDTVEAWFELNRMESRIIVWQLDVPPRS